MNYLKWIFYSAILSIFLYIVAETVLFDSGKLLPGFFSLPGFILLFLFLLGELFNVGYSLDYAKKKKANSK